MRTNRLGPRRLGERERPGARRGQAPAPPRQPQDRTGLFVGLGVGGGILILALAFAMSGGKSEAARVDRSADQGLKEDLEAAQGLANKKQLVEALAAIEYAIQNPNYRSSTLLPKARTQAEQWRKQIAYEREAAAAIEDFDKRITASKADKTAMTKAGDFWVELKELHTKYGSTAKAGILEAWRADLERWLGTNAQDVWQKDYNRQKERIKANHLDTGNFNQAVKEWRQFVESFDSADLRARLETELRAIDLQSKEAATKLVEKAGSGPRARMELEDALNRFAGTEGQNIIKQKLKTLP